MLFKVVLAGDANAGKTSVLYRYAHNKQHENPRPTIGIEFTSRMVELIDDYDDPQSDSEGEGEDSERLE